jgi:hypothetical protein
MPSTSGIRVYSVTAKTTRSVLKFLLERHSANNYNRHVIEFRGIGVRMSVGEYANNTGTVGQIRPKLFAPTAFIRGNCNFRLY